MTVAGGQHFVGENIAEALHNGVDIVAIGEAEETVKELLQAYTGQVPKQEVAGLAYLDGGRSAFYSPPGRPLKILIFILSLIFL